MVAIVVTLDDFTRKLSSRELMDKPVRLYMPRHAVAIPEIFIALRELL